MSAIALGVGLAGVGASIYGANKQAKAVKEANTTNDARLARQDQSAWNAYLISRGVNPGGAATGMLPTNPEAVNFKLPLYARASFTRPGAQKTWRKKGTAVAPGTLSRNTFMPSASANPYVPQIPLPQSGGGGGRIEGESSYPLL